MATMRVEGDPSPGELALYHEEVLVDIGEQPPPKMDTIVDPLVVSDLATVVWSPHGHPEAVDSLMRLAQVVLIDSRWSRTRGRGGAPGRELEERAYVVDLAWLRSTPWRERVAATFDPPRLRRELNAISSVTVRHRPDSVDHRGLLFCGWLASRLGWEPGNVMTTRRRAVRPLPRQAPGRGAEARARPHDDRAGPRGDHDPDRARAPRST